MRILESLRNSMDTLFQRDRARAEMEEELRSHVEHRADDLERSGLDRVTAERRARIEFGGREKYKEQIHEALGGNFFDTLGRDVRLALRVLRKAPGFTFAAVLTLALAIGANSVVFGVLNALILRPLNVPEPQNLYGTEYGDGSGWQSYPNYIDLRNNNRSFEDLAAFNFAFVGLDTGNDPALANGFATTGNYFDVLRVQPYLGRFFNASDDRGPSSAPYVVLSYAYWHTRFEGDRNVLGRVVRINKQPFTVIGVSPQDFVGTLVFISPDFFIPIVNQGQTTGVNLLTERGSADGLFEAFGHLKPGVTPAQAIADMNRVGSDLERKYPKEFVSAFPGHKGSSLTREGLTSFGGAIEGFLAGLMGLAGLILLAACANLGSLFAAHASDRSREVALRLALGSSRTRILRQLLTEAVLIAIAGGALGLWGSVFLLHKLGEWHPFPGAPLHVVATPDAKVYLVALALALVSGFLFGIVPVRQVMRANPYEIVKAGAAARMGRRLTVRDILLVVQIAVCAVLVTSSMVAVRGLMRSLHGDFGFDPANTMLVSVNTTTAGYTHDQVPALQRRMIDAVAGIPGVEKVGVVNNYPPLVYLAGSRSNVFKDQTRDLTAANVASMPYKYAISPGYLGAAQTSLLAGREFNWHDDKTAPAVAEVNKTFAVNLFGSVSDAIGRFFRMQDGSRVQIVGVVEDGKYMALTESQQPAIFLPSPQAPETLSYIVARSHRDPQQLAAAMRRKLHDVDAGLPVDTQTWGDLLNVVQFPARVATMSLGVLGILGAMLSITGIFGMAAYSVSKRLKELGIRIALGAKRSEVLGAALGRPLKLLACGSVAGLVLGLMATKVLAYIVYQASPRDPWVLGGVVLAMCLLGLLATWIPAQRALSVNPIALLREE